MTTGILKTHVGPSASRGALPIPMAILGAALVSTPFWIALGFAVALVS